MSPDVERTLREIPRLFPTPDHATTAATLRELRTTFARTPRARRRRRWALVLALVAAGVFGAVAWGISVDRPRVEGLPNPVHREGTFLCPRYSPAFDVSIEASASGFGGQASTRGAPLSRGGAIVYGQIREQHAAVDRVCRRIGRASAGRAAGFVSSSLLTPTQGTYVDTNDFTCVVRGRVLVRIDFLESAGKRVGTQLDVGIEGRRNLLARIVVRPTKATIRMSRACS
jgi:hypothetical protein